MNLYVAILDELEEISFMVLKVIRWLTEETTARSLPCLAVTCNRAQCSTSVQNRVSLNFIPFRTLYLGLEVGLDSGRFQPFEPDI